MRSRIAVVGVGALSFWATQAAAEEPLGTQGQLALSAERIFGLTMTTEKESSEEAGVSSESKSSSTRFTLLGIGNGGSPAAVPRLAIDYFVAEGIGIGGSIMYVTQSSEVESTSGPTTIKRDGPTQSGFILAPRVGYATMFNDEFGIWPRAGIAYYSLSSSTEGTGATPTNTELDASGLVLDLECMFAYSPVSHFAIIGGPVVDLPLSGSSERKTTTGPSTISTSEDDTFTSFGLMFGVSGLI
jgi:opacity protein-like surface antigen